MMQFPEREKLYYLSTFWGDAEAIGITQDNRYIYIGYLGSTNKIELYEISHADYLHFIQAYQSDDNFMLEQLRHECYLTPCIAMQASNYESNPVPLLTYDMSLYQEYVDFIRNHIVTEAVFSEKNTVILQTEQGKSLNLKLE